MQAFLDHESYRIVAIIIASTAIIRKLFARKQF